MVGAEIPNPIPGVEEAPTLPLAAALAAARAATGFCAEDEAAMIQQSNIIVDKLAAAVGPAGLDGLTRDEAAAINIYTQEEPHSIYSVLNGMLRKGDPGPLKQWFPYLKLLLTALHKLPSCPGTYNRSVSADIASQYTKGKKMVWWEFSSSTATIEALGAFMQVGEPRVLFQLEVKRAVDINRFSSFSGDEVVGGVGEDERLLLSGIPLEVKSIQPMGGGLMMIQMTEELDRPPLLPGFTLKPPPPWEVDPKEIKIDMEEDEDDDDGAMVKIELGRGSFGTVYAGRFRGHVVAIKQLPAGSEEMIKAFRSEASIAFRLQHKNVAHCYGGVIKQKFVRLISERLEASLHNELHIVKVEMPAEVVRGTISQVAQGLAYLHQNKVVHRDLKPDNVMRNAKHVWKLIDFGLASSRSSSMATKSSVSGANRGTAGYMAPELYTAAGGNHTVDTFAFAMLAYETSVRSPPFSGAEALAVPDMIKSGKRPDLVDSHANLTADISDLIRACWDHNPERRPDMLAVAAHLANAGSGARNPLALLEEDRAAKLQEAEDALRESKRLPSEMSRAKKMNTGGGPRAQPVATSRGGGAAAAEKRAVPGIMKSIPNAELKAKLLFEEIDRDGVGDVSLDELLEIIHTITEIDPASMLAKRVKLFGVDVVAAMIQTEFDSDGDGSVDKGEFISACTQDPGVMAMMMLSSVDCILKDKLAAHGALPPVSSDERASMKAAALKVMKATDAEVAKNAEKVAEKHAKRTRAFQELMAGEEKYVDDLRLLKMFEDAFFWEGTGGKEVPLMSKFECQQIFGLRGICLTRLTAVTMELWTNIKEAHDHWNVHHTQVANIFNRNPKLLSAMSEVYAKYNSQVVEVQTKIRAILDKKGKGYNPKIATVINNLEARGECKRKRLLDFLAAPGQRIMRYPMLIEAIMKSSTDNHPDKHGLIKAHHNLGQTVALVNSGVYTGSAWQMEYLGDDLKAWAKTIVKGDMFIKRDRSVIASLACKAIRIDSDGTERKEGDKIIYLLNDVVLVCSGTSSVQYIEGKPVPKKKKRGSFKIGSKSADLLFPDHDAFDFEDVALIEPMQVNRNYKKEGKRVVFTLEWWARDRLSTDIDLTATGHPRRPCTDVGNRAVLSYKFYVKDAAEELALFHFAAEFKAQREKKGLSMTKPVPVYTKTTAGKEAIFPDFESASRATGLGIPVIAAACKAGGDDRNRALASTTFLGLQGFEAIHKMNEICNVCKESAPDFDCPVPGCVFAYHFKCAQEGTAPTDPGWMCTYCSQFNTAEITKKHFEHEQGLLMKYPKVRRRNALTARAFKHEITEGGASEA